MGSAIYITRWPGKVNISVSYMLAQVSAYAILVKGRAKKWCANAIIRKSPSLWYKLCPDFCKDHLENASLHAKSMRLAMEAS